MKTTEDIYTLEVAEKLWEKLGDIPVDEDDCLEEDFPVIGFTFYVGTDKYDIWHWFEYAFNLSVATDLMKL